MTIRAYQVRRVSDGHFENWCPLCRNTASIHGSRTHECSGTEVCGPGCQLRRTLAWWRIRDNGSCGCHAYAAQMDADGPDGCERRIDEIVAHIVEQAEKRGVILGAIAAATATTLVRRAIDAARAEGAATPPPG